MDVRFKYLERIVFFLGLSIRPPKQSASKTWVCIGLMRTLLITLTVLAFMCYFTYDRVSKAGSSWKSVALLWVTHSRNWPSMAFLVYWQVSGGIEALYALFARERLRRLVSLAFLRRADICVSAFVVAAFAEHLSARIWALVYNLAGFKPTAELPILDPFGLSYGTILWTLLWVYKLIAGKLALGVQAITLIAIRRAFEEHNKNLAYLNCTASTSAESLARLLGQRMDDQIELNQVLFTVNKVFKMHTLVRTLLSVPRIIVIAWFAQSFYTAVDVSGALIETLMTMVCLVVLVVLPSMVHSTIKESEAILCRNPRIWSSYNKDVGHLARNLLLLTRQQSLGISLGGVTVITAGLIWTLASLLITFLTMFRELRSTPWSVAHPGLVFDNNSTTS